MLKKIYHRIIPVLADLFYGHPGKKMIVVGVTGTKGKSTTCRLIASVLEAGGYKVGLLSTVEFQIGDKRWLNDKKMSMLGKGQIQKMMKQMVEAGCQYAVIETSSEGILQNRHLGVHYDMAVFTNLGTEHSERHGGFENLKKAKGQLFADLKKHPNKILNGIKVDKVIVTNADDEHAPYFANFLADKKFHYGIKGKKIVSSATGTDFEALNRTFHLNILGEFNVPNALAAIAVGKSQGISDDKIAFGLAQVKVVEGRMEFIEEGQNFKVIVDYAHEPLSLTALFKTLRNLVGRDNKVIGVVVSDGGGRDIQKRGKMGEIAGGLCDFVVITDVNCFDEDPREIAEMLAKGARVAGKKDNVNLFIETDRRAGIKKAIQLAKPGDVVVITAKGTENVLCVAGGKKLPWDDREVARELIKEL
jgi:UDP-N-acetylmuramoyl-L-alanyl-D-glutamate--2,6-diaminopimelate ligase